MQKLDESRVRRVLGIPRSQIVRVIIAVGYAPSAELMKTRLPIERFIHRNGWREVTQ